MFISDIAIKTPVLTIVAMLALVVFGIVALTQLDTDEFPEIDAPDRRRRDPVSRRVARRRRARGHRADRRGDCRDQRRRPHAVELARRLRQHHRGVRLREGPAAGHAGDPRRDLRHPQRSAAGDGGADPHAVRPGGSADRVADAVVAGPDGRRADAAGRSGHHAAAARHLRRGAGRIWPAASSASWSSRSGRATCRRPASAWRRSCGRCSRRTWPRPSAGSRATLSERTIRLKGRLDAPADFKQLVVAAGGRPHRPARRRGRRPRRHRGAAHRSRSTTTKKPSASTSSSRAASAPRPWPTQCAARSTRSRRRCRPA